MLEVASSRQLSEQIIMGEDLESNLLIKNSIKNLSLCLAEVANSNAKVFQFN